MNALVAATHLLIPIQSSYFALEGTDDLLETVEKVRSRANPNLHILGVVITMHDKRTALARDIRSQIDKVFGAKVFKTVITKKRATRGSPAHKESIFAFAPSPAGQQSITACARRSWIVPKRGLPRQSACVTTRTTSKPSRARRAPRSDGWSSPNRRQPESAPPVAGDLSS